MNALGVDVGLRKGLDLVLLNDLRQVVDIKRRLPHEQFREVVLEWAPDVVAIDSPPRWASMEAVRATETAVRKLGIQLYVTPAEARRSVKGFHDWMIAGMDAFRAIEDRYELFTGEHMQQTAMEVFPHAAAVVLAGTLRPPLIEKHVWRRGVLTQRGIDQGSLVSPDLVDAALAALTGLYALEGNACWLGLPAEGVIVLPCIEAALPSRYPGAGIGSGAALLSPGD
jgi:predicted nuclease with RNAse H fold